MSQISARSMTDDPCNIDITMWWVVMCLLYVSILDSAVPYHRLKYIGFDTTTKRGCGESVCAVCMLVFLCELTHFFDRVLTLYIHIYYLHIYILWGHASRCNGCYPKIRQTTYAGQREKKRRHYYMYTDVWCVRVWLHALSQVMVMGMGFSPLIYINRTIRASLSLALTTRTPASVLFLRTFRVCGVPNEYKSPLFCGATGGHVLICSFD